MPNPLDIQKRIGEILQKEADAIDQATFGVLNEGKTLTGDLGGKAKGSEVAQAVIAKI